MSLTVNVLLFATCLLASVWLHYPGHVPYDGIMMWYEARRATLISGHPPMTALIWHYLEFIIRGPGGITLLQLLTLWLCPFLLNARMRPPVLLGAAFYAVLLVWPSIFALSGQIQKDVLGGNLAVLALITVAAPPRRPAGGLPVLAAFALATIATLLRYQFAIVFLGLFAALWWQDRHSPARLLRSSAKGVAVTALTTVLAVAAISSTFVRTGKGDVGQMTRKIMIYDIAGTIVNDPATPLPILTGAGVDEAALKERVQKLYTTARIDTLWIPDVLSLLDGVSDSMLWAQWKYNAVNAPAPLLEHRVRTFLRVIGFGDVYGCWPTYAGISKIPAEFARALDAGSYPVANSYSVLTHRYFPAGTLPFRPWIYGLVGVVLALGAVRRVTPLAAANLAVNPLLYDLSFAVLPQACDVRYSYYLMLATLCAAAMTAFAWAARRAPGTGTTRAEAAA